MKTAAPLTLIAAMSALAVTMRIACGFDSEVSEMFSAARLGWLPITAGLLILLHGVRLYRHAQSIDDRVVRAEPEARPALRVLPGGLSKSRAALDQTRSG